MIKAIIISLQFVDTYTHDYSFHHYSLYIQSVYSIAQISIPYNMINLLSLTVMIKRNNIHVICYMFLLCAMRKVGTYLYETSNIYPKHIPNVYLLQCHIHRKYSQTSYNLRMRMILGRLSHFQDATSIMQDRMSKLHLHYRETIMVVKDK